MYLNMGGGGESPLWKERKKKNNAKFSGHYVYPRTETVRAHALRSHQFQKNVLQDMLCLSVQLS